MRTEFLKGYAAALADVNRLHDCPGYVADAMRSCGLSVENFRKAGVEAYDLNELSKCVEEAGGSSSEQQDLMGSSHAES